MSQQDYDNFKRKLRDWMESHPEEYNCFVGEMNVSSDEGYRQILNTAFSLIPKYKKTLTKKINEGDFETTEDIEVLFKDENLADKLVKYVEKTPRGSIVPAMLAWLYYGDSFERMVEKGEELRKQSGSFFNKMWAMGGINFIISRSIHLGFRTKEDWKKHSKMMRLAESDDVVDWAIDQGSNYENKKAGRKPEIQILPKDKINQIGEFLRNKKSKTQLACLKIALEEMGLSKPGEIKAFRDALYNEFGDKRDIIGERGIQEAYASLTGLIAGGKQVKDQKDNREYIDQIIEFLSK